MNALSLGVALIAASLFAMPASAQFNPLPNPLPTISPLPTPGTNQQKTTASSVALPSTSSQNGWIIKASIKNVNPVMIGMGASCPVTAANDGTGNGYPLNPGEPISVATSNLNNICIISANSSTTDFVSWTGN